jgi:hypothetical protein
MAAGPSIKLEFPVESELFGDLADMKRELTELRELVNTLQATQSKHGDLIIESFSTMTKALIEQSEKPRKAVFDHNGRPVGSVPVENMKALLADRLQ